MAATHNLKIGDPSPICSLITSSPHSSLVCKPPLSATPPKGNASNFFGTTLSRIHSHQNSIPTLSRRLFLPSVSGLWDALTGGNSAREAVIAVRRGMFLFRQGDVLGSLVEFDKAIELDPRQKACAEQFRLDVAQNPNDTEESIWCFLCEAQLYGVDEARRRFLEVGTDPRPVMREAYNMFKDGGDPEKLVRAFSSGREGEFFYASLYAGLYYESQNKSDEAKLHLVAACKSPYGSRLGVSQCFLDNGDSQLLSMVSNSGLVPGTLFFFLSPSPSSMPELRLKRHLKFVFYFSLKDSHEKGKATTYSGMEW
ncbi:UNVERIFIED_CONTAM: hypothetical protein Slati_0814500 [Sesamum latifolium]|uniref:Uncharacterized protein n=1 Tax=Sesamum latifolium TaxID=2727402 RepID=A0AAW2XKX2_9LAMI